VPGPAGAVWCNADSAWHAGEFTRLMRLVQRDRAVHPSRHDMTGVLPQKPTAIVTLTVASDESLLCESEGGEGNGNRCQFIERGVAGNNISATCLGAVSTPNMPYVTPRRGMIPVRQGESTIPAKTADLDANYSERARPGP
jgi:hypothetical protein